MASINLPAGRWLVQAVFSISGDFAHNTFCALVQSDSAVIDYRTGVGDGTEHVGSVHVPMMAVLNLTSGSTPSRCAASTVTRTTCT